MYGFEAIAFYNGWAISAVGISIVFTALVTLSFIISQLHKLLALWENREVHVKKIKGLFAEKKTPVSPKKQVLTQDFHESARQFSILIKSLGEPFSLPKLIEMAEIIGIAKPHSTVNSLIQAKLIRPDEHGLFYLDHEAYQTFQTQE